MFHRFFSGSLQARPARFAHVEHSGKAWGVIKLQAFILHGFPLTCALTGSIKAQIDFTYQCSHCLTWRSSYVVHVCLITGDLAGSRRAGPASRITLLEKLTISSPQHLLDFSHKGDEMCLQRKCWCIHVLICSDSKQQKVLITSKFAE